MYFWAVLRISAWQLLRLDPFPELRRKFMFQVPTQKSTELTVPHLNGIPFSFLKTFKRLSSPKVLKSLNRVTLRSLTLQSSKSSVMRIWTHGSKSWFKWRATSWSPSATETSLRHRSASSRSSCSTPPYNLKCSPLPRRFSLRPCRWSISLIPILTAKITRKSSSRASMRVVMKSKSQLTCWRSLCTMSLKPLPRRTLRRTFRATWSSWWIKSLS